ncbi:MAG: choice-of-anchor D domain-containing protein, partial [Verrucomicrobiales bacterium]|nr:choice-of-anchor D domain-containing protein [Verrucomicrobiales bacterium]
EVPVGSRAQRTLVVRYLGAAPQILRAANPSAPFSLSPAVSNRTLQPGERLDLTVTFAPTVVGAASGNLSLQANDRTAPHVLPITTRNAYAERLVRLREGGPTLRGIAMLSTNVGWAVGDDGAFLRTDNGGRSWTTARPGFSGSFRAIASRGDLVVVAGLDGMAGASTDGGTTWRRIVDPIVTSPTNHWNAVSLMPLPTPAANNLNPGVGVVFAGFNDRGGIVARENNGPFVQAVAAAAALNAVAAQAPSATTIARLVAVGDGGLVLRSTDGGSSWSTNTLAGGFLNLRGVAFGSTGALDADADVWVVGDSGSLFVAPGIGGTLGRVFGPTTENFLATRAGYIVGENGSVYSRLPQIPNAPFVRENPSGAYHVFAQSSTTAGTWLAGEHGQIHVRPESAPVGPFLTFAPGEIDFGLLPTNGTRVVEVTVFNRGFAPLNVTGITRTGSGAFSSSVTQMSGIPTNGFRTFQVRFAPTSPGDHAAVIELAHNESSVRYRLPVRGRAQVNTWNPIASPSTIPLRDVQFVGDTTGYAISRSQVFRTTDRGTNWTALTAAPPSGLNRLHFFSGSLGFAFGGEAGRLFPSCTNTCASYILRTADGGNTWSLRSTPVATAVVDLHMASSTTGFAVTRATDQIGRLDTPGDVLRTTDGGLTWVVRTRPVPLSGVFDGTTIHATSTSTLFVAGNAGELHRSIDGGATWTRVLNLGSRIEDLQFLDANNGWLVGAGGAFRRTTTGGAISTAWTPQSAFTALTLRRVHFINLNTGWIAGYDDAEGGIFRTDNGGASWVREFAEGTTSGRVGPGSVWGLASGVGYAVNTDGVYRSGRFQQANLGSASLPPLTDFGVIAIGTNATRTITLRNPGVAPLNVASASLVAEDAAGAFEVLTAMPVTVPASGSRAIDVRYRPAGLGRHRAALVLGTDGYERTVRCDLVGEAQVFPTTLVFETEPAGLLIQLRQFSARGPARVTVVGESKVPDDVIDPFEWRFGTTNTVSVPTTQIRDGFEYRFLRWEPEQPETFDVVATNVPAVYRAVFVPTRPVSGVQGGELAAAGESGRLRLQGVAPAATGAPRDVPGGPYLRLSGATLELPTLGTAAVQGAAFLAGDRFSLALAGAALGDPRVLSASAGSWDVAFTNNTRFVVRARTPGLTVLNRPASAPSQVVFDVSASRIVAQLTLPRATPVIPAVAEFGPNTQLAFTNAVSGSTRVSTFRTSGELRLLAKPGGGFAVAQPFDFRASDGPFTNAITTFPATVLDTPLMRIAPAAGARVEIRRDAAGVFGVSLTQFNLSLLGGANTLVSGSLNGTRVAFTAGSTLALGSLRYVAQGPATVEWDFNGPSFKATVRPGTLTVPLLDRGLTFPDGLTVDTTGDFSRKIALPALTFDGIGVNGGGPIDHNFVRFYRENGVAGVELRDRRSFFDNTFKLAVNVDTAGTARGTFSGSLVIRNFLGCEAIGIPDLSLRYDSAFRDYQFRQDTRLETCLIGTHDFRVRFGTAGGKFCHLICTDGCFEDLCVP